MTFALVYLHSKVQLYISKQFGFSNKIRRWKGAMSFGPWYLLLTLVGLIIQIFGNCFSLYYRQRQRPKIIQRSFFNELLFIWVWVLVFLCIWVARTKFWQLWLSQPYYSLRRVTKVKVIICSKICWRYVKSSMWHPMFEIYHPLPELIVLKLLFFNFCTPL